MSSVALLGAEQPKRGLVGSDTIPVDQQKAGSPTRNGQVSPPSMPKGPRYSDLDISPRQAILIWQSGSQGSLALVKVSWSLAGLARARQPDHLHGSTRCLCYLVVSLPRQAR